MAPRKRTAKQANLDEEYRLSISESVPTSATTNKEPYSFRKRPRMPAPKTNTKKTAGNTAKNTAKDARYLVRKSTTTARGKSSATAKPAAPVIVASAAVRPQGIRKSERARKPPQLYEALGRAEERAARERLAAERALKRKNSTTTKTVKQSAKQPTKQPAKQPAKRPTKPPTKRPTKQATKQPAKQPRKQTTKQPVKQPTQGPTCDYCEATGTDVIMISSDSEHEPQQQGDAGEDSVSSRTLGRTDEGNDEGHASNPPQAGIAILQQQIAQLQQTIQNLTAQNQTLQAQYDDIHAQHEALVLSYGALEAASNTETSDQDMENRSQDLQTQLRDQAFQNQYQKALTAHQNLVAAHQNLQTQYDTLTDMNESLRRQLSRYTSVLPAQPDGPPLTGQERGGSPWRLGLEDFIDLSQAGPSSVLHDPDTILLAEHDPANHPDLSIEDIAGQTPLDAQEQQLVDRAFREGCLDPVFTEGAKAPSPDDQSMTDMPDFT
ncbi:hypothetical protein BDW42DRAFT_190163 [Aspergillus taichungensis]|uniref:Uncharacterized protein n=1 Tax=Aspergillus taichungensis TaxID=482145 RepID=A0A2J5I885_9EURO|nr:hypothetical protein BDW42DRAFT_190163 [Aspergillus taichungensis]